MLTNESKKFLLSDIVNSNKIKLYFFTNNIEITKETKRHDLLISKELSGKNIYPFMWEIGESKAYAEREITFNKLLNKKLEGYFLTYNENLLFVEKFNDGPYSISGNGDKIKIKISVSI